MRAILVHGGAGNWKRYAGKLGPYRDALRRAAIAGFEQLRRGGAVDAVEEAVKVLEDSGLFNAGAGSALTIDGRVEMDAGIMRGSDLRLGAVACVRRVRNPVSLARRLLEIDGHVMLTGEGADEVARRLGLPELDETKALSQEKLRRYEELRRRLREGAFRYEPVRRMLRAIGGDYGTVGAVAVADGELAAATSTGGIWLKLPGRVGDTPIPGAGFYADENAAASATGIGEVLIRALPCARACWLVALGLHPEEAAAAVIGFISRRFGSDNAGIIVLDRMGRPGCAFNTAGMARALLREGMDKPAVAILPEETLPAERRENL